MNLTHVPYKGTSGVLTDLIGNHVSAMFIPTHVAMPFMRDSQIRVLGIAGRGTLRPRCRTSPRCRSRGLARSRTTSGSGCWRRPGRRREIVTRYNTAINEIIRTKDMVASLARQGLVVSGGDPEVLRDLIVKDRAKWAKVIADAGIKAE